jgi:excisionase family DNA binding protein
MKPGKKLLSTREVAEYLSVNEKMVYSLVSDKGLPATKVTGKWLFPLHLVEQWVEANTINYPQPRSPLPPYEGLLIVTGSNDLLLERTIAMFNRRFPEEIAVFANLGSMGGLRALRQNRCHMASSHLLQETGDDYNFAFAGQELADMPAVVNFCLREQGIVVEKENPFAIRSVADLGKPGIRIVNRSLATGTRLLLDRELEKAGIRGGKIKGYDREVATHLEVGLAVASGEADAGPCIRPVAVLLGLDFLPLRWERYDLLITKERFFDKGVQNFLGLLLDPEFKEKAQALEGYDTGASGKIVYPIDGSSAK